MKSAESNNSKIRLAIVILTLVLVVSLLLMFFNIIENKMDKPYSGTRITSSFGLKDTLTDGANTYALKRDVTTFLILGLDKFNVEIENNEGYFNYQQSDFIVLLVIDNEAETVDALQINRDTITEVNVLGVAGQKISTKKEQIALSHAYGNTELVSCRNTADAVSNLLKGAPIDHVLSTTLDAVPILNDQVGGVEVYIEDDFSAIDKKLVQGTTMKLTGGQALEFIQSRVDMPEPTNLARMERQRVYMDGLFERLTVCTKENDEFASETMKKLADYITSNCTSGQLENIFTNISGYEFKGVVPLEGEAKIGEKYTEFYPDSAALEKTVIDLFYNKVK